MHAIVRRQVKEGPPTGTSASPRLPPIGHHAESTAQIARKVGTQWSNHSQFNRDPDIWISVSDVVLWALAKDAVQAHQKMNAGSSGNKVNATSTRSTAHATGSTIQVWSCGCSSGEEVYYTRMMWLQRFQQVFPELNLEVLGTDISADVIAACKRGQYENHSVSVLPKEWQESFFDPLSIKPYNLLPGAGIESVNRDHQLFGANRNKNAEAIAATVAGCAEAFRAARREKFEGAGSAQANTTSRRLRTESPVRKCVQFLQQDNRKEMPDGPFDLITCRYALVLYTKENLWHHLVRLIERLRVGGFLVIGKTESLPIGFAERFHLVRVLHPGNTSHSQDQIPGVFQKMTVDEKRTLREELESQQVKPAGASHTTVREGGKSTSVECGESNFIARLRNSEDFSTSAGSSDSSDGTSLKKRSQSLNGVDNDEHRIAQQRQAMERHQENGRSRSKGKHGAGGGASGAAPVDQHSRPTTSSGTTSKNVTAPADNKNVSAGFFEPTRSASVASLAKAPVRSQSLNSVSFGSGDASGKRQVEKSSLASRAWRKPLQKPVFYVPVEDTTATDPRLRSATYANFVRKYVGAQPDWVRYQKQALAHIGRPRVPMLDRSKEILNARADRQRGRAGDDNSATSRGEENLQKTMSIYERATIKAANLMKNSSAGGGGGDAEMSTNAGSDTHRRRDGESSSSADDSDHTPVGGAGTRSISASRTTVNSNSTAPGPSKPPFYAGNVNKAQELIHGKTGGYASVAGGYNKDREAATAPQGQETARRWSADVRVPANKEHSTTSVTTSTAVAGDGNKDSSGSGATSSATAERNAASSMTKSLAGNTLHASRTIPNAAPGQSGGSTYTYMRRSVSHTAGASSSTTATSTSAQHPSGGHNGSHGNNYAGGSAAASTTTGGDLDTGGAGALGSKKADYSHVRPKIDNKPPESTKRSHSEQPEGACPTRVKQTPRTANIYRNPSYKAHTKTDAGASNSTMSRREHKLATHRPIMGSKDPRTALLAEIGEVEKTLSNLEAQHQQRDDKVKSSEVKYGRGPSPRMEIHRQYYNVVSSAPMVDSVVSNLTAKHRPDRPPTPCRDRKRKKRASVYEIIDSSPLESGFANSSKNSSFATKYLKENGLFDGPSALISKKSPGVEYVKVPFTPTRVSMVSLGPGGGDPTFAGGGTSAGAVDVSGVQQQQLLAGASKYPGATAAQTAYGGAPNLFSRPQLQELNDFEAWKKETLQSASNASTVKSLRPPKGRPVSPITKLLMKNHTELTAQLNQKLAEDHVSLTALGTKYAREVLSGEDEDS
eukprot:g12853.t1